MSYRIEIPASARAEIKNLPGSVRAQARELIRALGENPRLPRSRELRDKPGIYRVWLAGRWRIAYRVEDDQQRIRILRVRHKDQIDYESLQSPE